MRSKTWLQLVCLLIGAGLCGLLPAWSMEGQAAALRPKGADPLAVGKAAMDHGDFAAAKKFFDDYLKDNPNDLEAVVYAGGTELRLEHYAVAVADFKQVLEQKPDQWLAHQNLALAYAEMGDWANFDKERSVIKEARDKHVAGLDPREPDVIDVLRVGGKMYQVWYYYTLNGPYHTRYVALHFDEKGKATYYIQCESDDIDQEFFKQKHPKDAAEGGRSFSLDTYHVGEGSLLPQALIKFYSDGEPTYETVRADILQVLEGQARAVASTTTGQK
jgi:tetratricopeptide (TPR) repeat protein